MDLEAQRTFRSALVSVAAVGEVLAAEVPVEEALEEVLVEAPAQPGPSVSVAHLQPQGVQPKEPVLTAVPVTVQVAEEV